MPGMRCEKRDISQTKSVTMRKKNISTSGDIQRISLETCMRRPHGAQLILWKSSSPTPSVSPAKIPNHVAINTSVPMGADDPLGTWDRVAEWRSVILCAQLGVSHNLT